LKHKQANLQDEKSTRALREEIYLINAGTDRQWKTAMFFTVATIIFVSHALHDINVADLLTILDI